MATLRGRRGTRAAVVGAVVTAATVVVAGSDAGAEPDGAEATYVVLYRNGASSRARRPRCRPPAGSWSPTTTPSAW